MISKQEKLDSNGIKSVKASLADLMSIDPGDLPDFVIIQAIKDPVYLSHLIASRSHKEFLSLLFREAEQKHTNIINDLEDSDLIKSLLKSINSWASEGFNLVSQEIFSARIKTCIDCEHCIEPPKDMLVYKILRSRKVCKLCGCDIHKKAKLASEACPDKEYGSTGRWKK